jgi:hypothetical protein
VGEELDGPTPSPAAQAPSGGVDRDGDSRRVDIAELFEEMDRNSRTIIVRDKERLEPIVIELKAALPK